MLAQLPTILLSLLSAQTVFTSPVDAENRAALFTDVGPLSSISASPLNLRPVPDFKPDFSPYNLHSRAADPGVSDQINQYLYLCTSPGCVDCYSVQISTLTKFTCYTFSLTYQSAAIVKAGNNIWDYSILLGTNSTSCAPNVLIRNPNTCQSFVGTTLQAGGTCQGIDVTGPTTPSRGCPF